MAAASALRVVGRDEPAGDAVLDQRLRAGGAGGEHGEPRRHRLDHDVAEALAAGGEDKEVGWRHRGGEVGIAVEVDARR